MSIGTDHHRQQKCWNIPTETTKRIQYVEWSELYIASTVLVLVNIYIYTYIELANIVIIRVPQCSISIRVPQYPVGYNNMAD